MGTFFANGDEHLEDDGDEHLEDDGHHHLAIK